MVTAKNKKFFFKLGFLIFIKSGGICAGCACHFESRKLNRLNLRTILRVMHACYFFHTGYIWALRY